MSNTNDDMKYVRNNLYGYGYQEQSYIAPTKSMNEIETDINLINEVNDTQTLEIDELKALIAELVEQALTKAEANTLYGASVSYNESSSILSLLNADGQVLSEAIVEGGSSAGIISIELVHEDDHGNVGVFLKIVFEKVLPSGDHEIATTYIDVSEISNIYTAGDGIEIDENKSISVKFDGESDYVTISENGINFSGLNESLSDVVSKTESLNEGVGLQLSNKDDGEVAFGKYNLSVEGETIFSIGNGTSDENRSNALEVRKDGSVLILIEGEMMNINELLSQIAHETY